MIQRALGWAVVAQFLIVGVVWADIPVEPRRPKQNGPRHAEAPVTIKYESLGKDYPRSQARIIIPRHLLEDLVTDRPRSNGMLPVSGPGQMPWTTVIAGLALAAAAVSGVWVIRRREARIAVAASLLVALTCGAWNLAHGDLLVPGSKPTKRPPNPNAQPPRAVSTIIIEASDDTDVATLIVRPK